MEKDHDRATEEKMVKIVVDTDKLFDSEEDVHVEVNDYVEVHSTKKPVDADELGSVQRVARNKQIYVPI